MGKERLERIYQKTDGHCHICHEALKFSNYGKFSASGSWHIDHSKPKSRGGTDHLNNLYAACIKCNLVKGVKSTNVVRKIHGHTRAPYSSRKKRTIEENNMLSGGLIGAIVGSVFGPPGIIIGSSLGVVFGSETSPKK